MQRQAMQNFYIKSMGCKSNQFEGQIVAQKLIESGFSQVKDLKNAYYYILNSCSVTQTSDNEAMYLLRHAHSLGLKTILTGCIAQIEKEKLLEEPFIDYVYGNEDKFRLANLILQDEVFSVKDLMQSTDFCKVTLNDTTKTRISLKIQDGCDNRCSYCIIPYGRGKSRSADSDFIINEINRYSDLGYKEVILTGIHIGLWGDKNILPLLKEIETKTSIPRYRLGSLNPHEITPELLTFLQNSEKFCPHFHLSLQSGCTETLKRMNRRYNTEQFRNIVNLIRKNYKDAILTADVIVGFPGETEEDFETTYNYLKKINFYKMHVFPYSPRKGTVAAKMPDQIQGDVKERRSKKLIELSNENQKQYNQNLIGKDVEVLFEEKNKEGYYKGHTQNYILVEYKTDEELENKIVKVNIKKAEVEYVIG